MARFCELIGINLNLSEDLIKNILKESFNYGIPTYWINEK